MKKFILFLFFSFNTYCCCVLYGRERQSAGRYDHTGSSDTSKLKPVASIKNTLRDSMKIGAAGDSLIKDGRALAGQLVKKLPDTAGINQQGKAWLNEKLKKNGLEKVRDIKKSANKDSLGFDLSVENGLLYLQKSPLKPGAAVLNTFAVTATITAGKIPFIIDFSKSYHSHVGFQPWESNLFKLNFDRQAYVNSMKTDLDRVDDFRKNVLKGQSLPAFTRKSISSRLDKMEGGKVLSRNPAFAEYIKDNDHVASLISMNEREMKDKLWSVIEESQKEKTDSLKRRLQSKEDRLSGLKEKSDIQKEKLAKLKEEVELKRENLASAGNKVKGQKEKVSALKEKAIEQKNLISSYPDSLQNRENALSAIIRDSISAANEKIAILKSLDSLQAKSIQMQEKLGQAIDSTVMAVSSVKQQIQSYGVDEERIGDFKDYLLTGNMSSLEPGVLGSLKDQSERRKVQMIFSKVRELQSGAFANTIPGSFFNQNIFIRGVNFSFNTRKGPLTVGVGSQNDLAQGKDVAFSSSAFSSPRLITYLSVPTNKTSFGSGKISWTGSFNQSAPYMPVMPRTNMALTVTQNIDMQKAGLLTVDISKSSSQYNNIVSGSEQMFLEKRSLVQNYFGSSLFETLSFGISHQSEVEALGLSHTLYFNYAGLGYQSPGATGLNSMRKRIGGSLRKQLFHNKITVNARADFKTSPASFTDDVNWKNHQLQLDGRYVINRNYSVGLKYLTSGMNKTGDLTGPLYSSTKYQVEGRASYKIGPHRSFSHLNIGRQNMNNQGITLQSGNVPAGNTEGQLRSGMLDADFVNVNFVQNVIFRGGLTFSATAFYNKELSDYKLVGNMINSEAGLQYTLLKKLSLSSSLTFLNNEGIARQAGIKQGLLFEAGKYFDFNAFMDLRKDLKASLYPDLYTTARGEISVKYYLKNPL